MYEHVVMLGRWDGLSNALYSLNKEGSFWVQYNPEVVDIFIEILDKNQFVWK